MRWKFLTYLCVIKFFAMFQISKAQLLEEDDRSQKTVTYGCEMDVVRDIQSNLTIMKLTNENMLLKLKDLTSGSIFNKLNLQDNEIFYKTIEDSIQHKLENQTEFLKENFHTSLKTIDEGIKVLQKTQAELSYQTKKNQENSMQDQDILKSLSQILYDEHEKLNDSIAFELKKIFEQQNINQFESNKLLENVSMVLNLLKNDLNEMYKLETDKVTNTQSVNCISSNLELNDFIEKAIQAALKEQENFLVEIVKQPKKSDNLKYSEKYLHSGTGICNIKNGLPENCEEALRGYSNCSEGIYLLYVPGYDLEPFYAYCMPDYNQPTAPAWTIIQRRQNEFVNFNRNWNSYKDGFGDVKTNFWLGLKYMHAMTSRQNYELWINMEDWEGEKRSARYDEFVVGNEKNHFPLSLLGEYSGDAGDSLSYHIGQKFTTIDADNDSANQINCAEKFLCGWWFAECRRSNPNGIYDLTVHGKGIIWSPWHASNYSFKYFHLAIRPKKV